MEKSIIMNKNIRRADRLHNITAEPLEYMRYNGHLPHENTKKAFY